ncbi:exonuclease domain-containing protein [Shewanella intestini]|uniref:3'-5' exonuclease n=1 Tax=Shewanella intestini TaxID=2017544 RepID=A0ABS5I7A8_9GAMM|nr:MULTISPECIES: exonuclease domain-containing protein [Shewanella]MBR9729215.1 3'-5' exonuclease [Shewanella intestini]MRG35360.1 3'-5' exonuclease [Shewanella sp. XMDDZSB0408]
MQPNHCAIPFVALDLEMTGLNPKTDQIISIGIVPINLDKLQLAQAQHKKLQIKGSVGDSAIIHGIVDHQLEQGVDTRTALLWLLTQLAGKVIVAHHGHLDIQFLKTQLNYHFGESVIFCYIDTLTIERERWLRQHDMIYEGCLRLGASRHRYHLPVYGAHSALIDALACGELFLAQRSAMGNGVNIQQWIELK